MNGTPAMLDLLPHVDLRSCWSIYRGEFGLWYAASTLVAGVFAARWLGRAAPHSAFLAGVAGTALSWLLIVRIPVTLFLLGLGFLAARTVGWRFDQTHPTVWMAAMGLSMALGGFNQALSHRMLLRQWPSRSTFWKLCVLQLLCLALASYRMYVFGMAHPPEA
ncbi:MAG: hypothetical protein QM757_47320 [Paludibaculum sp.]